MFAAIYLYIWKIDKQKKSNNCNIMKAIVVFERDALFLVSLLHPTFLQEGINIPSCIKDVK